MKSTQISPMFLSLTETEEASVCGGENLVISDKVIYGKAIRAKGSAGKGSVKVQTVKSTSTKVTKTTKVQKFEDLGLGSLDDLLSLLEEIDW